ncbi:hypothetical protein QJS10_CPB13g01635 [Acorus calamus]|uniref:BZIP domain-containing protein n=1 Tax=Acorus calamus TaxID=4465 RepID=A0AAV9DIB5_ACOCL|nr:hypothetical protein QJS10_CPB13g01635 [Acorus calamus]
MAEVELDAARALADFARVALLERDARVGARRRRRIPVRKIWRCRREMHGRDFGEQVEKEAKRMRRILANRESARQTIRRRQEIERKYLQWVLLLQDFYSLLNSRWWQLDLMVIQECNLSGMQVWKSQKNGA